ncbi:MAG: lamin tail domain-containing protein [Myxococcales bacterium]|nr:lamin tail domain-containing protein [Myxococcales bacterium]
MKPHLLLGLTLTTAAACGDDGNVTTGLTTETTGTTAEDTSGSPTTNDPDTTTPTTDGPTSTTAPTSDTSTDTTAVDPSTTTTTETTQGPTSAPDTDTDTTAGDTGTSTGTSGDTTGTSTGDETTGTSTGGESTGTTDTGTDDTSTGDALDDEIYDVQNGTIAEGVDVDVQGVIVTAIATTKSGFFAQEMDGGEFSGVWVFVGAMGPDISGLAVGDEVDVTGVTQEFNGLTELNASAGTVMETGVSGVVIDPELLPIATFTDPVLAEPWEGVHVAVAGAPLTVSQVLPGDEFQLSDGDTAVVDNLAYSVPMAPVDFPSFGVDASFTQVAGPLNYSANTFKIVPRGKADLQGYMPPLNPKLGVEDLVAGDLVVTEVMYNPTCAGDNCEWIEIFNNTAQQVDLNGLVIQDSLQQANQQGKVNVSVLVDPGAYAVLGKTTMVNWPYPNPPAAFYGANPALNNSGGDQVFLKNSTITIDKSAAYTTVMGDQGLSWKLAPTKVNAVDNDVAANWCYSADVFYMAEKGSPGVANEAACTPLP